MDTGIYARMQEGRKEHRLRHSISSANCRLIDTKTRDISSRNVHASAVLSVHASIRATCVRRSRVMRQGIRILPLFSASLARLTRTCLSHSQSRCMDSLQRQP